MRQILANPLLPKESSLQPRAGEAVAVAGKLFHWRAVSAPDDALDFHRLFGMETRNQAVYAVAQFDLAEEHKNAALMLGSDDGARVWLNGREVWTTDEIRGVNADQDLVEG
jgi:hypothetical protein